MVNKVKRIITRYISLILAIGITLPLFGDLTINVSAKKGVAYPLRLWYTK